MDHQEDRKEQQILSRRKFFSSTGSFLAGAAVTAAGGTLIAQKALAENSPAKKETVTWPYPYVKLDPEDVRVRAYLGYYKLK